jgi:hypothetical protein
MNYKYYNNLILTKLSLYLNNKSDSISKDLIKGLNVNEEDAYKYLLAAFLDLDINNNDKDLYNLYFPLMVKKLDINKYQNNLYLKNVHLNKIKYKNWQIKILKYKPYEAFVYNDLEKLPDGRIIPKIGYFNEEYNYPAILENNREWMLITPNEINTMQVPIENANGNVLTYGLGLGYFAYMISLKENVNKITIIENNEDIINIFKKYLLPQFKFKNKIEIINDDALNYATKKLNYDYVFVDIWHDPSDGIDLYLKFKKLEVKGIKYDYWIEQTMKCYIEE